jgi:hypothetical protein
MKRNIVIFLIIIILFIVLFGIGYAIYALSDRLGIGPPRSATATESEMSEVV